jgi:hypothetical protein
MEHGCFAGWRKRNAVQGSWWYQGEKERFARVIRRFLADARAAAPTRGVMNLWI